MIDMEDITTLELVYQRLKDKHGEFSYSDYMVLFRKIIEKLRHNIMHSESDAGIIVMSDLETLEFLYQRLKENHGEIIDSELIYYFSIVIEKISDNIMRQESKQANEDKIIETEPKIVNEDYDKSDLADKLRKSNYFIKSEPRMVNEYFGHKVAKVSPKSTGMDKLILLITLPKGSSFKDADYSSHSLYEDVIHYVTIGNNDYMKVEVLSKPPNEMSILWGLFKWTYR